MSPTTRTKTKLDPSKVYKARESVRFALGEVINTGQRLRGDHQLVRDHFEYFVEDGVPIPLHPQPDPSAEPQSDPTVAASVYEGPPEPIDAVSLTRPLRVLYRNEAVELDRGVIFAAGCELARVLPDAFERVKR